MCKQMVLIITMAMVFLCAGCNGSHVDGGYSADIKVGNNNMSFNTSGLGYDSADSDVIFLFENYSSPGVGVRPNAYMTFEGVTSFVAGTPYQVEDLIIHLDDEEDFWDDSDHTLTFTFTHIEWVNLGRCSGTIAGEVLGDLDDDDEDEIYAVTGSFNNIPVMIM